MTQTFEQMAARVERLETEIADLRAALDAERSDQRLGRSIEQMRRGESRDAREALLELRAELFPDAPPYAQRPIDVDGNPTR